MDSAARSGRQTTGQLGDNEIQIRVNDTRGAFATQTFIVAVTADTVAPQVVVIPSETQVDVGSTVDILVQAIDNVGVEDLVLTVDGVIIPLDSDGNGSVELDTVGSFIASASATDAAGNVSQATAEIIAIDSSDVIAPVLSIDNVTDGDLLTAPTDIIGSVTDDNLIFYTLSYATIDSDFVEYFRNTTAVDGDLLGTFDPTTLPNDEYFIQLYAIDAGGNEAFETRQISVAGDLKIGNFTVSFTDVSVPVSGIPIVVTRTYDSINAASQNDLGYGWRLEIRDADVRTSVRPTGLEDDLIYNPFFDGARVYVTLPGGQREGFTFSPQPAPGLAGSFLGIFKPNFEADARSH